MMNHEEILHDKIDKQLLQFDDDDFGENDMENDYKNLVIYQKHKATLYLLHLQKRHDFGVYSFCLVSIVH
jgi:hypothetical protein